MKVLYDFSLITDYDVYLFREGSHCRLYEKLGCHFLKMVPTLPFGLPMLSRSLSLETSTDGTSTPCL